MENQPTHCGFVTLAGRTNVGKSTLLNRILGQKLSITSRKPQTTRLQISGIKTDHNGQAIYIDTPGLQTKPINEFNRLMNREALNSLSHMDVVIHVISAMIWNEADINVYEHIKKLQCPVILAINKIDRVNDKQKLLPFINNLNLKKLYVEIVPISARNGYNVDILETYVSKQLPPGIPLFPSDQITDRSERFFASELIREKLIRRLGKELPYNISVSIDKFKDTEKLIEIQALIWVANHGQKKIVIGKNGAVLKVIGEQARFDLENMFNKKVYLQTWVKTKNNWTNNEQALRMLGYEY